MDEYPSAFTEPGTAYFAIQDRSFDYDPPESKLRLLSAQLKTDVLWLAFQSVVDAFQFHHWIAGTHVRSLVYGCGGPEERMWERVEGKAEPWEWAAIIERKPRPPGIVELDDVEEPDQQDREILPSPGQFEPALDARETARKVAEFYRLPGWWLESEGCRS
jgi:hypothetical protein